VLYHFKNNELKKEMDYVEFSKIVEKNKTAYQIKYFINAYNVESKETVLISDTKIIVLDSTYSFTYSIPLLVKSPSVFPENSPNWYQFLPNQTLFYGNKQAEPPAD